MLQFIKELYLTAFTLFFRSGRLQWSRRTSEGIGVALVSLMECMVALSTSAWVDVAAGERILLPIFRFSKLGFIIFWVLLYLANRYPLISLGYGIAFEREFNSLERAKKIRLIVVLAIAMAIVATSLVLAGIAYHKLPR